jgi:hypothetical protein
MQVGDGEQGAGRPVQGTLRIEQQTLAGEVDRGSGHARLTNTDRGAGRYDVTGRLNTAGSGTDGVYHLKP